MSPLRPSDRPPPLGLGLAVTAVAVAATGVIFPLEEITPASLGIVYIPGGSSVGAPTATRSSGCWRPRPSIASSSRRPTPVRRGLSGDDLVWLLEKAPAEVMILRPGPDDHNLVAARSNGRPAEARRRMQP